MKKVITISGKAKAGKDTASQFIATTLEKHGNKVFIIHYADYLKFICRKYFKWNGKKDEAGRSLLQWVGTDIIRACKPDFLLMIVADIIEVFSEKYDYFIIPDARFPNEIEGLKGKAFPVVTLRVERNETKAVAKEVMKNPLSIRSIFNRLKSSNLIIVSNNNGLTYGQRVHKSETSLDGYCYDYTISATSKKWLHVCCKGFTEFLINGSDAL